MELLWKNITLLGTSHIADESVKDIEQAVRKLSPDLICIELDFARYHALVNEIPSRLSLGLIRHVGMSGFLFALIGRAVQKRLGDVVGMTPGSDMRKAIELAEETHVSLRLIDQPIEATLRDFSHKFTLREKSRLVKDMLIPPKQARSLPLRKTDLRKVPERELISALISFVQSRYPGLYDALIGKRNRVMARRLFALHHEPAGKRILAVVGAGHLEGIHEELLRLERSAEVVKRA